MDEISLLQELGLTEAESRAYLALLDTGSTTAGPLIKKTGLHRATAYQILNRLKEKGLASSVIKGKKQCFEPAHPQRLLDVLHERQESLHALLPQLQARLNAGKEKQDIKVYYGIKGIRTVFDRLLEELSPNGAYYDFGVSGLFREKMGTYWDHWQKTKKEQKIKAYVIFNSDVGKQVPQVLKEYVGVARFNPKGFSSLTDTFIYNNTVVLVIWTANPPIAVVIENAQNAKSYKNQFLLMWKNAKK